MYYKDNLIFGFLKNRFLKTFKRMIFVSDLFLMFQWIFIYLYHLAGAK